MTRRRPPSGHGREHAHAGVDGAVIAGKLIDILHDVGFPSGVVNFLPGEGATVGHFLVWHGDVNIVAFTGSPDVGTRVIRTGSEIQPDQGFI
ncbi:MAG: aldehyde dehydrogenase family protein, partial [Chloroflexi bacterium]|nr:aldehyde dehydrogenase family protein [Chloroflexota bacterium]